MYNPTRQSIPCQLTMSFVMMILSLSTRGQGKDRLIVPNKTHKASRWSFETVFRKSRAAPGHKFYGTWSDFHSNHIQINEDSSFIYFHQSAHEDNRIIGKWSRTVDTFYFTSSNSGVGNTRDPELPARLAFYEFKLFPIDSIERLIVLNKQLPRENNKVQDRAWFFRNRKFNKAYYDSGYLQRSLAQHMRFGIGANGSLQPVQDYPNAEWIGFIFSTRYLFHKTASSYLSVGSPITLAFTVIDIPDRIEPALALGVDIPLIFNYNRKLFWNQPKLGGEYFIGGGISYRYGEYNSSSKILDSVVQQTANGFGPMVNIGVRLSTGKYRLRSVELRLSFMRILAAPGANVFGIGLLKNF